MKRSLLSLACVVTAAAAAPAGAFTFFSVGATTGAAAGDPGLASYETAAVTFDAAPVAGVVNTTSGTVALYSGTSGSAAAPAGDTGVYQALGSGGASLFDFTGYAATHAVNAFSVYVGSVDAYNFIDVLDRNLDVIATITGAELPGNNGDQGASITNRRLYVAATPGESFGGLRFRSDSVAFEYDTIGVSAATFPNVTPGATPLVVPVPATVPEPAAWLLMIAGFSLTGVAARRRRITVAA